MQAGCKDLLTQKMDVFDNRKKKESSMMLWRVGWIQRFSAYNELRLVDLGSVVSMAVLVMKCWIGRVGSCETVMEGPCQPKHMQAEVTI